MQISLRPRQWEFKSLETKRLPKLISMMKKMISSQWT